MEPALIAFGLGVGMLVGMTGIGGVNVLDALERARGREFDDLVLTILAVALRFTGLATLARALFGKRLDDPDRERIDMQARHKVAAVALGVFVGFVLGLTSAGSGGLIAVGLILAFRLVPTRVVGTDVFHAAVLLWAAAAASRFGNRTAFSPLGHPSSGRLGLAS